MGLVSEFLTFSYGTLAHATRSQVPSDNEFTYIKKSHKSPSSFANTRFILFILLYGK